MNGYGNVIKRNMITTPETQLRIDFDNRDRFIDITTDDLHIPYRETEILLGHTFKHITKGIFKASPGFYADKNMMNQLHNKYPEVVFCVATDKGNVSYVCSSTHVLPSQKYRGILLLPVIPRINSGSF